MEALGVCSTHNASKVITKAFAKGAKWRCIPVKDYREGPVAIYGLARGLAEVLRIARQDHDCIRLDHGYMASGHFTGHYSVTKNVIQHTGEGEYDAKRLDPIRPSMSPMRHGEHILLLPPSRLLASFIGLDVNEWISGCKKLQTDRPIRIREKYVGKAAGKKYGVQVSTAPEVPLEEDLKNCHAVVTFNSKAAIKASCEGISVFTTHPCCVTAISQPWLSIDNPELNIDREGWLRALSYNQFTLDEMRERPHMPALREIWA